MSPKHIPVLVAAAAFTQALAAPPGCPYDATGDGRVDAEDLYYLTQNPADINGDGFADGGDVACLTEYLRCAERREMAAGRGRPAPDGRVPGLVYRETKTPDGLVQSLEVTRVQSPDGPTCIDQTWTIELLGVDQSLSGPLALRMDRDGFLWSGFNGDLLQAQTGDTSTIPAASLCAGSALELVADLPGVEVGSLDASRVLVLLDGRNAFELAEAKGVPDAAMRPVGGAFIDAFVDANGDVSLPDGPGSMLVLFELDETDPQSVGFAFDDLAVLVDQGCGTIEAVLCNFAGMFTSGTRLTPRNVDDVTLADVDSNGVLDILVANQSGLPILGIHLGIGDGTFQDAATYGPDVNAFGIDASDLNGDGAIDVVVSAVFQGIYPFLNNGNGLFAIGERLPTAPIYFVPYVRIADMDGDGDCDVVTRDDRSVEVFVNNGNAVFSLADDEVADGNQAGLEVADLNGDGFPDVVVGAGDSGPGGFRVQVFLNSGTPNILPAGESYFPQNGNRVNDVAVGDVDGDGHIDIVACGRDSESISVFYNTGDGTFAPSIDLDSGDSSESVELADLDQDGDIDIVIQNGSNRLLFFENVGGLFENPISTTVASIIIEEIALGDLNSDGLPDVVVGAEDGGIFVFLNNCGGD